MGHPSFAVVRSEIRGFFAVLRMTSMVVGGYCVFGAGG
jgi:hypothetical protein